MPACARSRLFPGAIRRASATPRARASRWRRSMSSGTVETTATSDIQAREARHVLQTYRRFPVAFVRGEGVRLFDAEGRAYLDLLSGLGVAALGNGSPAIASAIAAQAGEVAHTSHLFFHPLASPLAGR